MSHQTRQSVVGIFGSAAIFGLYALIVIQRYLALSPTGGGRLRFWATAYLVFIPIYMALRILIHLVFVVVRRIVTKEAEPEITDEVDRLISLKADRVAYYIQALGVVAAVAVLAALEEPAWAVGVCYLSSWLSDLGGNLTRIHFYRQGF